MNQGAIKTEAGIATALVRIKNKAGEVKVVAKTKNLSPSSYQFKVAE